MDYCKYTILGFHRELKKLLGILLGIAALSLLSGTVISAQGAVILPSPNEQTDSGISAANVVCNSDLTLIIRSSSESPACVKSSSVEKLVKNGWAIKLETLLEKFPNLSSIGQVRTVQIVPLYKDEGIQQTQPNIVLNHNFVFEACAKSRVIQYPEILISTDSETKSIKLSAPLNPGSCQISSTMIKATDTTTIKANLVKKTDLSLVVSQLEKKVTALKDKLATEKKSLTDLAKQTSTPDYQKRIGEKTDLIESLRNELNQARAELQQNQYLLILGVKEPEAIKVPMQNKEVLPSTRSLKDGVPHVNTIEIVNQYSDAGRLKSDALVSSYNFVFEACAGEKEILFPEILVKSDTETKSLKLGNSLGPEECQVNTTLINAAKTSSIQASVVTTGEISDQIKTLEEKVETLKNDLAVNKKALADLAKQTPQPEDFRQKVTELTDTIEKQRDDLNKTRQELINLKYMVSE